MGCVLKTAPPQQLVHGVREVLHEGTFLCQQAQYAVVEFLHRIFSRGHQAKLSPREREVVILLLNKEKRIAAKLNLSKKTVDAHVQNAFKKLRRPS